MPVEVRLGLMMALVPLAPFIGFAIGVVLWSAWQRMKRKEG